jgi:hypothetical protein
LARWAGKCTHNPGGDSYLDGTGPSSHSLGGGGGGWSLQVTSAGGGCASRHRQ